MFLTTELHLLPCAKWKDEKYFLLKKPEVILLIVWRKKPVYFPGFHIIGASDRQAGLKVKGLEKAML